MTLLIEVMQRPLDPGYAAAAAERRAGARRWGPGSLVATVLTAVLCGWGTTAAVVELRRPQPAAIEARRALEKEVLRRTAQVEQLQRDNETLRAAISVAQQAALAGQGRSAAAIHNQNLGVISGELPVTGPGLELTMDDAPGAGQQMAGVDPRQNGESEDGRVIDRDLQIVVNGLWAAGAEAMAVNGERLTALSAIRSAGQAILVDFRPLSPPYVIQAIGDPKALQSRFSADMAGSYLQSLTSNYGIRSGMAAKEAMTLPGAGSLSLRNAQVPGSAAPTGRDAPSGTPSTTPTQAPGGTTPSGTLRRSGSPSGRSSPGTSGTAAGIVQPSSASPGGPLAAGPAAQGTVLGASTASEVSW